MPFGVLPSEASYAGIRSQEHFLEIFNEVSSESAAIIANNIDYGAAKTRLEKYIFKNHLLMDTYSEERANGLFEIMAANNTWHTPTLSMWQKNAWFETEIKEDTALYKYLPPYMRRYWQIGENDHLNNRTPKLIALKQRQVTFYKKMLKGMYEAGVPLLTGTDMGANPLCFPGIGVHNELEAFVEAGIPTAVALKAATINPCEYLEIDDDFGSVEAGRIADLVILSGNPLEEISAVRAVDAVVRKGYLYSKDDIDQILTKIEESFK
ncbi:MAG: amidohydrolase family protein [Cyclobacteriaceae bacterium]